MDSLNYEIAALDLFGQQLKGTFTKGIKEVEFERQSINGVTNRYFKNGSIRGVVFV